MALTTAVAVCALGVVVGAAARAHSGGPHCAAVAADLCAWRPADRSPQVLARGVAVDQRAVGQRAAVDQRAAADQRSAAAVVGGVARGTGEYDDDAAAADKVN